MVTFNSLDSAVPGAATSIPPIFDVQAVSVAFDGHPVLNALDWQAQSAQVIGLLGRNGAGKTTLLETILGLRRPDAGKAHLFGQPAGDPGDAVRAKIGYVPQVSEMFDWLTPKQLLNYFRAFYPRWSDARAQGLMSRWGIPPDRVIGKLSQGQQQRLSIIRALAPQPELLVLDEPVASLDPAGRRDFLRELVDEVLDRGTTILFSTHILSDLERVAFDIAFLNRGKIALQAPLDQLIEHSRRLCGSEAARAAFIAEHRLAPLSAINQTASTLVRWPQEGDVAAQAPQLAIERVTLDELFMELTQ